MFRTRTRVHRHACCALLTAALLAFAAFPTAQAHPLGDDSISHFNVLDVRPDQLQVDFLLDIAETPAQYLEQREMDSDKDGRVTREEQIEWLNTQASEFAGQLTARIDGKPLRLQVVPDEVDEQTGNLTDANKLIVPLLSPLGMTYRVIIRYSAVYPEPLGPGEHILSFEDGTLRSYRGLRLMLLLPGNLCHIKAIDSGSILDDPAQRVPTWMSAQLDAKGLQLENASLERSAATGLGYRRWQLLDAKRRYALVEQEGYFEVYPVPYCEFQAPHPPFMTSGYEVFQYDQYDPFHLPNVHRATVRFMMFPPQPHKPGADAATDSQADPPTASSQPESPTASGLPPYFDTFLNSTSGTSKPAVHAQQAENMIELLKGRWGVTLFFLVTVTAFAWGAAHALMPGHAKTMVAAYLISQNGTYWQAAALAVIVTVTHTALVIILGVVIYLYQRDNPRLGPMLQLWLGLVAGILVAGMGALLVWQALTGRIAAHDHHHHDHSGNQPRSWIRRLFTHSHPHLPAHAHHHHHDAHEPAHAHHHEHVHAHEPAHAHAHEHTSVHGGLRIISVQRHRHRAKPLTLGALLVMGIAGGIIPCPTATIILLLGIGADVIVGALYAIVVFSMGLALTLMLIGTVALSSRRFATKLMSRSSHEGELTGWGSRVLLQLVPALSGLAVVLLGSAIVIHYACRINGVQSPPFSWIG